MIPSNSITRWEAAMKTKVFFILSLSLLLLMLGGFTLNQRLHAQLQPRQANLLGRMAMEEFYLNTDASGLAQFTLTYPVDGNLVQVLCHTEDRFVAMTDIAGNDVSVKILKCAYDKTADYSGTTLGELPTGVIASDTLQAIHGGTGAPMGYGVYAQPGTGQYASSGHAHQVTASVPFIYKHNHNLYTIQTALPAAGNESGLRVVVLYKRL